MGFGLALAITLILIAKPLTGLFSQSESIQVVAVHYLWIVAISYGAYGLVMSMNAAFNGMGKPLPGVVISACRVIVVFLPLAFAGRYLMGLEGLFAATLLSNLLMGVVAYSWLGRQIRAARAESGL
jgi:Na+-driven multidrug efflux pump